MNPTKVKNLLTENGKTHWQLADAIGINASTLSVWLRHDLTGDKLERVCEALTKLGLSADSLKGGEC